MSLSNKLADRATRADRAFAHYDATRQTEQKKDLAQQFFQKMTGFFTFLKDTVTFK